MASFSDYTFLSCNGKTDIHVRCCTPDGQPRAVLQIAHGIAERIERYDGFMEFMAANGFVVVGNDHLGHGKSFSGEEDRGFFAENSGWEMVVGDMRKLYEDTSEKYKGLPYFIFGHSMGSFLTRTYLIRYRDGLSGAVISGTGQQPAALVSCGKLLSGMEIKRHGSRYASPMLNKLFFGSYNRDLKPHRTEYDWLTRDESIVDWYINDPLCGFIPSAGLCRDMMGGIEFISRERNTRRMNKQLPVFFISGSMDPVGENGRGVQRAYNLFLKSGMEDVTMKLYPDGRHELLNETNRDEVMSDILNWLNSKM